MQHRLEGKLQQTQKIEALGTLAGGIAHDFNNILGVIIGYTEMSLRDIRNPDTVKRNLDQVLKASERARELVQQILTFSHKNEQELRPVALNPLIRETLKMLRSSLPKSIRIRQKLHPELLTILSNPSQVHQVLMNLCTNAVHAMEEKGGTLEIRLRPDQVSGEDEWRERSLLPGDYVRLTVSDTGCGIDESIIQKIFDPFFTTKEVGKGTGMGLAVVHGIVKNHKGNIRIHSRPGEGSVFDLFFPRILCKIKGDTKDECTLPTGNGHILLVDDEELLTEVGRQMLERLGYTADCFNDPLAALDFFRKHAAGFDMLISDMTMPGMNGAELAGQLLQLRPEIPVILCTGYSDHMSEEKAKEMGISALLFKPLDITRLAMAIHHILKKE